MRSVWERKSSGVDSDEGAGARTALGRDRIRLPLGPVETSPPRWPPEAFAVILIFGVLVAITVTGASVATARAGRERDAAAASLERERSEVRELERELATVTGERDVLKDLVENGSGGNARQPARVADHTAGRYAVGVEIAPGTWAGSAPACRVVRFNARTERMVAQGTGADGVRVVTGETVWLEGEGCWWEYEGP